LRNALAASYSQQFDRKLDPETEILVTAGANEGNLH
jgi:kynurenine aminotransferase